MKPLGTKAYGSIPHLPGSRRGPGDHGISEQQAKILTEKTRDRHDVVFVEEKLDGSNVAVAKVDGKIVALTRSGYEASTSPYEQHHLFGEWVRDREETFQLLLGERERISGEWLALAHGTRYFGVTRESVFAPFDIFGADGKRFSRSAFEAACGDWFMLPARIHWGGTAIGIEQAYRLAGQCQSRNIATGEDPEGIVYRVERKGVVDFLAKWVKPGKEDGRYLSSVTGAPDVWNWRPR